MATQLLTMVVLNNLPFGKTDWNDK